MNVSTFGLVMAGVFLNAIAQLFLKSGTKATGVINLASGELISTILRVAFQPYIVAGLMCYVLSVAIWIGALSRVDVSIAYPMLSIGYVLNAVAAWYLFGEAFTSSKVTGIAFIMLGTYFISKA